MTETPPVIKPGARAWSFPRTYYRDLKLPTKITFDPVPQINGGEPVTITRTKAQLQRVRYATIGIQTELIDLGYLKRPKQPLTGQIGSQTETAIKAFQKATGHLTVDGIVGPMTARRLFAPRFLWWQTAMSIPSNLLYGLARLESGMDPGAQGALDDADRGILQFNARAHPDVTDDLAYGQPGWCIQRAAGTLRQVAMHMAQIQKWPSKTDPWLLAIASWNNPSAALAWANDGAPGNESIASYVQLVVQNAGAAL